MIYSGFMIRILIGSATKMSQIASRGGYGYSSRGGGLDSRRMNSLHGSSGLQNEHGGGRPFGGGNGGPSNSHNRNHDSFDRNPRVVGVPDVSRFTPRGQISDKNPGNFYFEKELTFARECKIVLYALENGHQQHLKSY